jgi:hypothetical protein
LRKKRLASRFYRALLTLNTPSIKTVNSAKNCKKILDFTGQVIIIAQGQFQQKNRDINCSVFRSFHHPPPKPDSLYRGLAFLMSLAVKPEKMGD